MVGEALAAHILERLNFTIMERNYTRRVGEIDIIATKGAQIYFFEVKKSNTSAYNPLQNISYKKLRSMQKTVNCYLAENRLLVVANYSIGAISITTRNGLLFVEMFENI